MHGLRNVLVSVALPDEPITRPLLDYIHLVLANFFFPCTNTNLSNTSTALVPLQVEDEARGFAIEHSQDQLVKGPERKEKKGKKIVDGLSFFSFFVCRH